MIEWLKEVWGALATFVWHKPSDEVSKAVYLQFERLHLAMYLFNVLLIFALLLLLAYFIFRARRSERLRRGFNPLARWIILSLALAYSSWTAEYVVELRLFHQGSFPLDSQYVKHPDLNTKSVYKEHPSLQYTAPLLSATTALFFFMAGSLLLELHGDRFHRLLPKPTTAGYDRLKGLSPLLDNSVARILFSSFALIVVVIQWISPGGWLGVIGDAVVGAVGHIAFGLGLLRELNRQSPDKLAVSAASTQLGYGFLQFFAIRPEFFFLEYFLAGCLKGALFLTMGGFAVMIQQMERQQDTTRDETLRKALEVLRAVKVDLPHEILGAINRLLGPDQRDAAKARLKGFIDSLDDSLVVKEIDLAILLENRKKDLENNLANATVYKHGGGPYLIRAAPFLLNCAIDRVLENAVDADAFTFLLDRSDAGVSLEIRNNGQAIPEHLVLSGMIKEGHGLKVVEDLLSLIGATIKLASPNPPTFRIEMNSSTGVVVSVPAQAREAVA